MTGPEDPTPAEGLTVPMVLPEPVFPLVAGEDPGARIARIVQTYAGCSLTERREDLAALVGRGVDDESVVTIETNCAMFALGILKAAGVAHPLLDTKYVDGMAFAWLVEIGTDMKAWRSPDPSTPIPAGAAMWYRVAGANDDHVEFLIAPGGPSTEPVHGGAGRSGNAVTVGKGAIETSDGRPLHVWLDPDALGLEVLELHSDPPPDPHT